MHLLVGILPCSNTGRKGTLAWDNHPADFFGQHVAHTFLFNIKGKTFYTIILDFLLGYNSYSQKANNIKTEANEAVKLFRWDIQKAERGTLIFLYVPYQHDISDSIEYLILTIAKEKTKERSDFISIIISNNVSQSDGIFIKFANTVTKDGERIMELEKGNPVRVNFEKCNDEICTARIIKGYTADDNGNKDDVFLKFMTFDDVLFLIVYPDGNHKSVAVPLFSFKELQELFAEQQKRL